MGPLRSDEQMGNFNKKGELFLCVQALLPAAVELNISLNIFMLGEMKNNKKTVWVNGSMALLVSVTRTDTQARRTRKPSELEEIEMGEAVHVGLCDRRLK